MRFPAIVFCSLLLCFSPLVVTEFSAAQDAAVSQNVPASLQVEEDAYDLGTIERGKLFRHEFIFRNNGEREIRFLKAIAQIPGDIRVKMPSVLPAGASKPVSISLDSNSAQGTTLLKVIIVTDDPAHPEVLLTLQGYVQWPIEILPKPLVLIKSQIGQEQVREFTLVNHTDTPLEIRQTELDERLFGMEATEVEKGKVFHLTLSTKPDAPPGEYREQICFHTNIPKAPKVRLNAWLKMLERVYTNIDRLDFGELEIEKLRDRNTLIWTTETVIINGMSTPGFQVTQARCDIPFLVADLNPKSTNGVHRVDVYFQPEKLKKGDFQGHLTIATNDADFREIVLPISGKIR